MSVSEFIYVVDCKFVCSGSSFHSYCDPTDVAISLQFLSQIDANNWDLEYATHVHPI